MVFIKIGGIKILVAVRYISGTKDNLKMDRVEFEIFSKWLMDDNSRTTYVYEKQCCDNNENVYIYKNQTHTCYIFKDKIEYVDFSST